MKRAHNPTLTALKVLLRGDADFYIHADINPLRESWSSEAIFTLSARRKVRGAEIISKVQIKGVIRNGHTSERVTEPTRTGDSYSREYKRYSETYRPEQGFWSLYAQADMLRSAVAALPSDVEPKFEVALDAGTNQYAINELIHIDHLYLFAQREGHRGRYGSDCWRFLLDINTGPHNTARFGSPTHDADRKGRAS